MEHVVLQYFQKVNKMLYFNTQKWQKDLREYIRSCQKLYFVEDTKVSVSIKNNKMQTNVH